MIARTQIANCENLKKNVWSGNKLLLVAFAFYNTRLLKLI